METNYRVATGIILNEYLNENNISAKELAISLGISEKYILEVLIGNSRVTEEMAINLEKVLPGIPASYWINLENKYCEFLNKEKENNKLDQSNLVEISKKFKFKEVFKGLDWDLTKQANEMLKILKISNFAAFNNTYSNLKVDFFEDGGQIEPIAVWINLCKEEADLQNDDINNIKYSKDNLEENLHLFKKIAYNSNINNTLKSCKKLCNQLGIYFVELEAISNSKVRGALLTYNGHPAIFISRRFKSHDHVWFAIAHEIGHLLKHYEMNDLLISFEEESTNVKEKEANEFSRNLFIPEENYKSFVEKGDFSSKSIELFSAKNKILSGILVARLQHDNFIRMSSLNYKKDR